MSYVTKYT